MLTPGGNPVKEGPVDKTGMYKQVHIQMYKYCEGVCYDQLCSAAPNVWREPKCT